MAALGEIAAPDCQFLRPVGPLFGLGIVVLGSIFDHFPVYNWTQRSATGAELARRRRWGTNWSQRRLIRPVGPYFCSRRGRWGRSLTTFRYITGPSGDNHRVPDVARIKWTVLRIARRPRHRRCRRGWTRRVRRRRWQGRWPVVQDSELFGARAATSQRSARSATQLAAAPGSSGGEATRTSSVMPRPARCATCPGPPSLNATASSSSLASRFTA